MKSGNKPVFGYQGQSSISSEQGAGLTKREYFSAMAMQGLIASHGGGGGGEQCAKQSVTFADALLAELDKPI